MYLKKIVNETYSYDYYYTYTVIMNKMKIIFRQKRQRTPLIMLS